jgi:hypothetical protein
MVISLSHRLVIFAFLLASLSTAQSSAPDVEYTPHPSDIGSPYVPIGNWVYPALDRLIARGYIKSAFQGLRPWTRITCAELVTEARDSSENGLPPRDVERMIVQLEDELAPELRELSGDRARDLEVESVYSRVTGISGPPVNDSYHFGQTIINDFGRPYEEGFNNVTGFSALGHGGRFALYTAGEYQHAPSTEAYAESVREIISKADNIPIPAATPVTTTNQFRLLDTYVSGNALGLDFSLGKQSLWWGPTKSGPMAISDNATPFWMFRIDRNDPFRIPFLSRFTGPFRVDAFFGELSGHHFPPQSFIHAQKISFKPTQNLEFGFSRVAVFAGANHVPLTFGSFFTSVFSLQDVSATTKLSRNDPGARHSAFDAAYRVPGLRDWVTIYTDSIVHDDVSPISAPHRAAFNPGFYVSHFPRLSNVDFRAEAVYTDPPSDPVAGGQFIYWESVYRDAYLNHGSLFGSWIGRQGKGYQSWLTYWISPKSSAQLSYRESKVSPKFIPGGTTQNDFTLKTDIWLRSKVNLTASVQYERWSIPVLAPRDKRNLTSSVQLSFWPKEWLGIHGGGRPRSHEPGS